MRTTKKINDAWLFTKISASLEDVKSMIKKYELFEKKPVEAVDQVDLPHTWNGLDGQDGGDDYYRGYGCYYRVFDRPKGERVYIEFEAAALMAVVFINGKEVGTHKGGFSRFRFDITEKLHDRDNRICVLVDNSIIPDVYPQRADFTFYGGIYRDVKIITVGKSHFDMDYHGGSGVKVTSTPQDNGALVVVDAYISKPNPQYLLQFDIRDMEGHCVASCSAVANKHVEVKFFLPDATLWDGIDNPYMYSVDGLILCHNDVVDEVSTSFGIRTFYVDPEKGFFLNGRSYPLRGVCRHQDRMNLGNALTDEMHLEDMALIQEVGANAIRLAHYQHSQVFYDACDKVGMVVWAEIPFITYISDDPGAYENSRNQLSELIVQNYNHPCIAFWGIENEITVLGYSEVINDQLKGLNALAKEMDPTRLTTLANINMVPADYVHNKITDVVGYNIYFGWYVEELPHNGQWLDDVHSIIKEKGLCISEYGCEGIISYHSETPKRMDYTEEYQALYHEYLLTVIEERPWLWGTFVWNMFDFGADLRCEGGVGGRNNKGLMTFDRKIRKDAFYIYKAYWSKEEFVHLCGKRYSVRPSNTTSIKVYANVSDVTLYIDGNEFGTQRVNEHKTEFLNVPISKEGSMISVMSGRLVDSMFIRHSESAVLAYDVDGTQELKDWFE